MTLRSIWPAVWGMLGLVLALASAAAWLAPFSWLFDLATHFRLQYFYGFLVTLSALAIGGRWRWVLALFPVALANALPLLPYFPHAIAVASSARRITLVNVNLLSSNRHYETLLTSLEQKSPDLVLLLEFNERWRKDLAPLDARYPYQVRVAKAGPYGIALLSRIPFIDARSFMLGATPAIEARVVFEGQALHVVGVHLRSPVSSRRAAERNEQLLELEALATRDQERIVFFGDFNSTPFSPYFKGWLERSGLTDSALSRGLTITWPVFLPMLGIPIDHCIVSDDLAVLDRERLPAFGSDHYPLLTVIGPKEHR
jgi:endonuclease/exonuclease/phosphatase (EEP) superfamily protein YafD